MRYVRWVAYRQQKLISHSSGGQKSKIEVLGNAMSGESCLLICRCTFLLCLPGVEGARDLSGALFP